MAGGGGHHPFRSDPAVERWSTMHATMYQRFRMTPKATRQVLSLGVLVPLAFYATAVYTDDKIDLQGKLRDDSLLRRQPAASAEAESSEN